MFVRASKRRLQHDVHRLPISPSSGIDLLHLPFLCPILYQQPKHVRRTSTSVQTQDPSRPDLKQSRSKLARQTVSGAPSLQRGLASAAGEISYQPPQDDFVPFEDLSLIRQDYQPSFDKHSIIALPKFDPDTSPIFINDSLAAQPKKFRQKNAVSGNLNEIHQTLHACLQVGRLERAAALIRRLNQIYKPDAPGLLVAHNEYVRELTLRIVQAKDQQLLKHLQRWFVVDLQGAGVTPDAATYALMIQASLQESDVKKIRTVRRYVGLARDAGLGDETEALVSALEEVGPLANPYFHAITKTALTESPENEPPTLDTALGPVPDGIPEVRNMDQKGLGLSTLKKSLAIFSDPIHTSSPDHLHNTDLTGTNAIERQRQLEQNTLDAAIDRWRAEDAHLKSIGVNSGLSSSSIGSMMWKWHEALVPLIQDEVRKSIEAEKKETKSKANTDRLLWGPYLQFLSPEKISAITILSATKSAACDGIADRGVRLQSVVRNIGDAIQTEGVDESVGKNRKNSNWLDLSQPENLGHLKNMNKKRQPHDVLKKPVRSSRSQAYDRLEWDVSIRIKIGAVVLSHLMDIAKVPISRRDPNTGIEMRDLQPVFFRTYQFITGKRVGVVRLNSVVVEKLAKAPVSSVLAKYLPMVAEPKPWVGFREGGFLEHPVPVLRLNPTDVQQKRYAITAAENGDMSQVFAGLDVLAKTRWRVNRFVFDVMLAAWNKGEAIAKIPPENPPADYPAEPLPSDDPKPRRLWMRQVREAENHRAGLKSQRCFQNFQLEVARAYLNETFYFPHNCDFRGRAYPIPPFLNHMGADNSRGLLLFAKGKELTTAGLWWLKVHLANVFGYDKASFEDRLKFTNDHLSDIYDSVNNPLDGNRWWLKAEDPWQCLAACKEVKNALDSPDPAKYVCQLAIHQDGTCNGLQHYAALGGDVVGAQQVNLVPGHRPSDIYTGVAEMVKADIADDAVQGLELARALEGRVTRKVVKQTVMTNVYGVTFIGAKRQVRKQLHELFPDFPNTGAVSLQRAAPYIAKKIFQALSKMFNGAHDIQYWLGDCAARICESLSPQQIDYIEREAKGEKPPNHFRLKRLKSTVKDEYTAFKSSVIWTTPLKMPVVQPYRKTSTRRIETILQGVTTLHKSDADPVDKKKQLQGFPPNFIHSLDATHMFLTALKCHEVGLTFASIHDSFWTHAGDVDTMSKIIRDAFIMMHSEDIVGRLAAEFKARYKGHMHLAQVRNDSAIGQNIMAWRRSQPKSKNLEKSKMDELLLERRRLDLLAADNPAEREEGENMVTPGKIFADSADERALAPLETPPATIGEMPTTPLRSTRLKANQQLKVGDLENVEAAEAMLGNDAAVGAGSEAESMEAGTNTSEANDPITEEDADTLADADEDAEVSVGQDEGSKKKKSVRKTWVWLPLTFPPVPKKGDFDVTRLKDSQYFFS